MINGTDLERSPLESNISLKNPVILTPGEISPDLYRLSCADIQTWIFFRL